LLDRFIDSPILVTGRFQNAVEPNNALPDGQVELAIDDVLVPHNLLKDRKTLLVPRHIASKDKFLVALEANAGKLEAVAGHPIDEKGDIVKFFRGALQLKDKSALGRIRYSVDFLRSPHKEVADSAHHQLRDASYADLRRVGEPLRAEPLLQALQDANTPNEHLGTFGMLLGHCGKKEHAVLLRKLIDRHAQQALIGMHGLFLGNVLLEPEIGWNFIVKHAQQKEKSFLSRYAALRAMRLLGDERKDLVDAKKWAAGIARILNVPDMADFAIEDLRKRQCWDHCDAVLDLHGKPAFRSLVIRNSMLRFALQCPLPAAKTFVVLERARDPESVSDTEELLALETDGVGPAKK
jgi:hypothetical protein